MHFSDIDVGLIVVPLIKTCFAGQCHASFVHGFTITSKFVLHKAQGWFVRVVIMHCPWMSLKVWMVLLEVTDDNLQRDCIGQHIIMHLYLLMYMVQVNESKRTWRSGVGGHHDQCRAN